MPSTNLKEQLRMRVFAGPNGSGKSTIINYVKKAKVNGRPVDFGFYINADEIASALKKKSFSFRRFGFSTSNQEFKTVALASGLIKAYFNEEAFAGSYSFSLNAISAREPAYTERLAQVIADFLRKKLLERRAKFSFETVFSHEGKLDIMRQAREQGYKVYLYFVSTESPEINKARVLARVAKGGHDVPPDKIEQRYDRSMQNLYAACQLAYQVYFFDNSADHHPKQSKEKEAFFAHFKLVKERKAWEIDEERTPFWFFTYYANKVGKPF